MLSAFGSDTESSEEHPANAQFPTEIRSGAYKSSSVPQFAKALASTELMNWQPTVHRFSHSINALWSTAFMFSSATLRIVSELMALKS